VNNCPIETWWPNNRPPSLNQSMIHLVVSTPSLNKMATYNINLDVAIQVKFSGFVGGVRIDL
jgi:hypothetical protein